MTTTTTNQWPLGVFDCLSSPNLGPTCCVAHCCCQPCVWSSALEAIDVKNSSILGLFLCCGGRGILDEFAGYVGRRKVLQKYKIEETDLTTGCISCLCGPCGRVQEVDTIVQREGLTYGVLSVRKPPTPVRAAPVQASIARPVVRSSRV